MQTITERLAQQDAPTIPALEDESMKIIKTDGYESSDPSLTIPTEVHLHSDGRATAVHPDHRDEEFASLAALNDAYELALDPADAEDEQS
jgi:hypothetical protein